MSREILTKKPLLEAIFELRWELRQQPGRVATDPHYKLLIGAMYDRVRDDYGFHEPLPAANMPDEIAAYVVQHRFRESQNGWPLIQIGPGIVTLNDTAGYVWEDFEKRVSRLLDSLFEAYPNARRDLVVNKLLLRYVDGVVFDFETDNVFSFLKDNMKLNIHIDKMLFNNTGVKDFPKGLDLRVSFASTKPVGAIQLRFARGKKQTSDALIWETNVLTVGKEVPAGKDGILRWVQSAHTLTDDWFFKTISGELLGRFR